MLAFVAATCFSSGACLFPSVRGDGAPKSANLWFVPCGTRAPLGAPIATSLRHRAPLAGESRSISQLLPGAPSGPGRSSDTARALMLHT
jgi:hypothetical protein